MKTFITVVTTLLSAWTAAAAPADEQFYASRYDHLDVDNVLNNRRMVNYYAACLLSKGPCPPQGLELKRILPEALQSNCARCTEKQRTIAYRTIKRLKKEYPKIWDQLEAIWDPDRIYVSKFEASFEKPKPSVIAASPSSESPFIANRFGDDEPAANNAVTPSPPPSTTTRTTSTAASTSTTTKTTTITTSTKPTNKPVSSVSITSKPQQAPPYTTVGANLHSTVSFGTNLVGGIVRSLGTIGTRVVESGTRIANMVISAVIRP